MKHEWRKNEKELYLPKSKPTLIEVAKYKYFTISGKGNPNNVDFSERIGILYNLSYAVKMMLKSKIKIDNYYEYTVYPLEGIWDLSEEGRKQDKLNKDELVYKIMIRQPDFLTNDIAKQIIEIVRNKNNNELFNDAKFEEIEDGKCLQMLHIGSYDTEPKSFDEMNTFLKDNKIERKTLIHKEIYLSDFRKTEPSKLKTVLRYFIK